MVKEKKQAGSSTGRILNRQDPQQAGSSTGRILNRQDPQQAGSSTGRILNRQDPQQAGSSTGRILNRQDPQQAGSSTGRILNRQDPQQAVAADDWDRASNAQRAWMIFNAISEGKMDQEKIKRLLDVADQQDQIKLKVLHNAVVKCIKDYQTESTSAHLNDWQKAETALEAFVVELWGKHFESERSLQNALAVVDYLSAQGWKVRKSAVYNHKKEGKLRPQPDGTFRIADVERYAETYLRRKDGGDSGKLDKLQQQKLVAEIEKTKAQAEHWSMKAKTFSGAFVPKELFESELAKRAAVFKNDLETFARSEAGGIVSLSGGDAGKIPDVIEMIIGRIEAFLARYSEEKEFKVPLPPADPEDDKEEEKEGDE